MTVSQHQVKSSFLKFRAKEARSDIDRAKVVVGEGSKVIVGQEFDADRDDVSEAGEREVGVRSTTAPKYSDKDYWERRFQETVG